MKLAIEHVFAIAPAAFETLYFDEAFNIAQGEALSLSREVRKLERTPERIVRHVWWEPRVAPGAKPKTRAGFTDELDYDVGTRRGMWRTIPSMYGDRGQMSGTIEFVAAGEGTKRIVRGEVAVRMFGLGRIIEKIIVTEVEKSFEATAKFTRDWLAR